jgi:hypothetical protein
MNNYLKMFKILQQIKQLLKTVLNAFLRGSNVFGYIVSFYREVRQKHQKN